MNDSHWMCHHNSHAKVSTQYEPEFQALKQWSFSFYSYQVRQVLVHNFFLFYNLYIFSRMTHEPNLEWVRWKTPKYLSYIMNITPFWLNDYERNHLIWDQRKLFSLRKLEKPLGRIMPIGKSILYQMHVSNPVIYFLIMHFRWKNVCATKTVIWIRKLVVH